MLALEAIRRGRDVGYVKQADLLILSYLRTINEDFYRDNEEHDLMLYNFLKKKLAKFENDFNAIKEQVNRYQLAKEVEIYRASSKERAELLQFAEYLHSVTNEIEEMLIVKH